MSKRLPKQETNPCILVVQSAFGPHTLQEFHVGTYTSYLLSKIVHVRNKIAIKGKERKGTELKHLIVIQTCFRPVSDHDSDIDCMLSSFLT